jgi:hypothetical protein
METQIDIAGTDERGDGNGTESSNRYLQLWVGRTESLEKKRQIKIRTEPMQDAQMQQSANDAVLRADCRDSGLECRERGTGVFQELQRENAAVSSGSRSSVLASRPGRGILTRPNPSERVAQCRDTHICV